MTRVLESSRAALAALALVVLGFFVTLNRVPILWSDDSLYASIARSVQEYGDGVPLMLRSIPDTQDHVTIYGPVFFKAAGGFGAGILAWSIVAHGEPLGWVRTLMPIVPKVGEEVTFAAGATRDGVAQRGELRKLDLVCSDTQGFPEHTSPWRSPVPAHAGRGSGAGFARRLRLP